MSTGYGWEEETATEREEHSAHLGIALTLGALAALGVGIAIQQMLTRRLSKPEIARLKFYRYLRERGRLES